MKKKIIVLAGTRPEAIKLAPIILELKKNADLFEAVICASGQHNEMLCQALSDFEIVPDMNLSVMRSGQSLAGVTARLFEAIDHLLESERPDWILVQGDTTTAMVGALCSFYRRVKIGHVEAGLRSHNRWAPFPEEVNRRVAGMVADRHFAPTDRAKRNLLSEGVAESDILVTGNTVVDALLWMIERVRREQPSLSAEVLKALSNGKRMVLVTGHRRESFGPGFEQICLAIRTLAEMYRDVVFIYPVHLNPNVQEPVMRLLGKVERVLLTAPLTYKPFVWLMDRSALILTDSGGIQEEAPSLGKPVLVMRKVTERPEGVEAGTSRLVGTDRDQIVEGVTSALKSLGESRSVPLPYNPYGDGLAAQRIVQALRS
ncbi:non-hydrolyzing UDP-N-acetylglucosamine 2-epimerase [Candidatus Manganitrophus noduliformans]|uniref:UDP-N-acetylglucosamine 2-epimerase (non-hydrolyzing) n=1 Tax=Candidatus Manganitrophus noduliformans TaxID=2606439 RepID=A0A7X6IC65_9BACT|nr:UDP-N-acetylglucosamine 2-epimerase (non-hydrolyzing) [Candidatus Manganitrophus noduliformans]NKE72129.1 UDP-N-acetylglucosamine 2-epimerase (non-hydrolyzing) [Candidatus Manganitrophus noduliformans]